MIFMNFLFGAETKLYPYLYFMLVTITTSLVVEFLFMKNAYA